jgi:SAM-dependent methyltransferase
LARAARAATRQLTRSSNLHTKSTISSWVARFDAALPPGPVLDLACGGGRHLRHFHARGHPVTGVDRDLTGVADLAGVAGVELIAADLEAAGAPWPLGDRRFAAVVVTNYLWRPLLGAIVAAVAPDGWLIYETFARGNERYGKPRNPDFLLRPGELLAAVAGDLAVVAYEHGTLTRPGPAVVQRIAAVRGDVTAVIDSAPIVL